MSEDRYSLEWDVLGGAVKKGHFINPDGLHADTFLDIGELSMDPVAMTAVCHALIKKNGVFDIDVVLGRGHSGAVLAHGGAHALARLTGRAVKAAWTETDHRLDAFTAGEGVAIHAKRALLIDGSLMRPWSVMPHGPLKDLAEQARFIGADVVGAVAIVNRDGVTAEDIDVPRLCVLVDEAPRLSPVTECSYCIDLKAKHDAKRQKDSTTAA